MPKDLTKKRKQDLGIFYTPPEVVEFIYEILNIWKNKEDKENHRWQSRKPKPHYPSVVDPACGEGIFLKKAVDSRFTTPSYIWGVDLDEKVKEEWKIITLLKSFGSKANLDFHFYHQDGLMPIPEKIVSHKKGGMNQYDAVVGNPPYGGMGIGEITKELEASLFEYEIWKKAVQKQSKEITTQLGLMENTIKNRDKERLKKFPIEILFLDRFIQLAKPSGWIAIIIPDGILSNSNSHYVREFISQRTKLEAIVSLPRKTFKGVGTNAKTSILFLRKLAKEDKPKNLYPVFMASIEEIKKEFFNKIVISYEKFYNLGENCMNNSDSHKVIPDQTGREAVMLRVDKTLKDLMEEKPSSRWNPNYWHPKYDNLYEKVSFKILPFKSFISDVQGGGGGSHFSAFLDDRWDSQDHFATYLHISALMETGINWVDAKYVDEKTYKRLITKQLRVRDILLSNKGTVGKSVVVSREYPKTIVGDTRVIRVKGINPFYVCVYFKSKYGKKLSERFKSGVASEGTTVDQLGVFKIPFVPEKIQLQIEAVYKKMSSFHDKAMEAKKNDDEKVYKENMDVAEKMLEDLIKKTEEVIEGNREDVN